MYDPATTTVVTYHGPATGAFPASMPLPSTDVTAEAGFPLPTADFSASEVDLGEILVPNPLASFLYRAAGNSMIMDGILDGDFLLVDRSLNPRSGDLVVATFMGQAPICKRLRLDGDRIILESRNPHHKPIEVPEGVEVECFCVRSVARVVRRG